MRISDWSSDVCSSEATAALDLRLPRCITEGREQLRSLRQRGLGRVPGALLLLDVSEDQQRGAEVGRVVVSPSPVDRGHRVGAGRRQLALLGQRAGPTGADLKGAR